MRPSVQIPWLCGVSGVVLGVVCLVWYLAVVPGVVSDRVSSDSLAEPNGATS